MAATASLVARLSGQIGEFQKSFEDAIRTTSQFEKKYAGVASSVQDQQQRLNKAFASFAGDNLIRDANALVGAITRVGGTSKLTAAEQARANQTLTEAIAKYNALGQVAPASMVALAAATKQAASSSDALEDKITKFGAALKSAGAGMKTIGVGLSATVTAPLVAGFAASAKAAIDFESSFAGVRKTVDASEAEFGQMAQAFRDLAKEIPVSVNDLNRLGEAAGALGIPKGEIVGFAKVMAELGVTTNLTADEAADSIARIQNIFGAAGKDTERFASTLVALGNAGASTERDIVSMATRIAGAGNTVGLTQGQVLGFASALSSVGIEAEAGGTAISKVFIELASASSKGGSALEDFARVAGMSGAAFKKSFDTDAAGATTSFIEGLGRIKKSGGDLFGTLESLGLSEVRVRDALLRAAGAGDLLRSSLELQNKAWSANTALTNEAQQRFKTTESQLALLWNRVKDLGITLGNGLLPYINLTIAGFDRLLPFVEGMVKGFVALPGPIQAVGLAIAGIAAAAGPVLLVLGTMATGLGALLPTLAGLGVTSAASATGVGVLTGALGVLATALPVVALLGALTVALVQVGEAARNAGQAWREGRLMELLTAKEDDNFVRRWLGLSGALKSVAEIAPVVGSRYGDVQNLFTRGLEPIRNTSFALEDASKGFRQFGESVAKSATPFADSLGKAKAEIASLSAAARNDLVNAIRSGAVEMDTLKAKSGLSEIALKLLTQQVKTTAAEIKKSDFAGELRKKLADLTAQIDLAAKNKTALPELVKLFGDEAAKAVPKANAWGVAVKGSVAEVSRAFNELAKDKTFEKLNDGFTKFANARFEATFKKLQAAAHDSAEAFVDFLKTLDKLSDGFTSFANKRFEKTFERLTGQMKSTEQVAAELGNTFGKVFKRVGASLAEDFAQGFQQGGITGAMVSVASGASAKFGEVFKAGTARVLKDSLDGLDTKLTFGEKAAGWGALAAQSFVTGFATGMENPGTVGALSSVASGFLSGLAVGGPWGGFAGAGIALAANILGSFANADKERAALEVAIADVKRQFHGVEALKKLAERSNFTIAGLSPSESIDKLFRAPNAESFNRVVGLLNDSLDAYNEKLKAISASTEAVNRRSAAFGKQFEPLVAARTSAKDSGDTGAAAIASQQIQELAQRTQPEFNRLGLFVKDTFSAMVKESGDAFAAITALAPSFQTLKSGITDFGLTSTAVIDSLIGSFDIVNNDAFKPFFENIQSTGQLLQGLDAAKALSPETFQAAAADIGQSIQEIVNRGGDMAKALALSAPQLQTLWEAQQRYGAVTDQTTQSILDQAVQQGVVGEAMKSVNDKILDVLLAIADVFGAQIPAGLANTARASDAAGASLETGLGQGARTAATTIDTSIGSTLAGLGARARTAAGDISNELAGVRVPDLTIAGSVDVPRQPGSADPRFRTATASTVIPFTQDTTGLPDWLRELQTQTVATAASMDAEFQAVFQRAGASADTSLGAALRTIAQDAALAFSGSAQTVESTLGAALRNLGPEAQAVASQITAALADIVSASQGTVATTVAQSVDGMDQQAREAAARVGAALGTIFAELAAKADGSLAQTLAGLEPTAQGVAAFIAGLLQQTFTDAGQTVDITIGQSLRNLGPTAREVAEQMGGVVGDALKGIPRVFDETVGASLRELGPTALEVARGMGGVFGDAFKGLPIVVDGTIVRSLRGLGPQARMAANDISTELGRIRVDPIKISFDVPDLDLGGIPQLATGGIARKRTLAVVGEAGPEVIAPLSKLDSLRPRQPSQPAAGSRVVFHPGSVVINGPVDSDERAAQVVRDFAKEIRRGGRSRTLALEALGVD